MTNYRFKSSDNHFYTNRDTVTDTCYRIVDLLQACLEQAILQDERKDERISSAFQDHLENNSIKNWKDPEVITALIIFERLYGGTAYEALERGLIELGVSDPQEES